LGQKIAQYYFKITYRFAIKMQQLTPYFEKQKTFKLKKVKEKRITKSSGFLNQ